MMVVGAQAHAAEEATVLRASSGAEAPGNILSVGTSSAPSRMKENENKLSIRYNSCFQEANLQILGKIDFIKAVVKLYLV